MAASAADRFWETDREHRYTYVSEPVGRLKIPTETFLGRRPWELEYGRRTPQGTEAVDDGIRSKQAFRDVTFVISDEDGSRTHVKVSGTPFFDDDGEFQGFRGTLTDETDEIIF